MEKLNFADSSTFNKNLTLQIDEYIKDGIVYCKKCNTPRRASFCDGDEVRVFPIRCKCQEQAFKVEKKRQQEAELHTRIENERNDAFAVKSFYNYRFELDDGQTPRLTEIMKKFVENFHEFGKNGQGLILYGGVGTGKTFYAACIANSLIDKGYRVRHTSLAEIVQNTQNFDYAKDYFNKLLNKHCIIIDDLGTERTTKFADEQIYKFIDGCYTQGIVLIITTNYEPQEFVEASRDMSNLKYARTYSRILERCMPLCVNELKRRENNALKNKAEMAELLGLKRKSEI